MQQPRTLDSRFEQFLQALPADYEAMAYEFKAFARARKIRSPLQLLEVVMLYCGLDFSLRSCTGEVAQLQGYLSDTAIKKDSQPVHCGSKRCWRVCSTWNLWWITARYASSLLMAPRY